jgi:hypothetical protein
MLYARLDRSAMFLDFLRYAQTPACVTIQWIIVFEEIFTDLIFHMHDLMIIAAYSYFVILQLCVIC